MLVTYYWALEFLISPTAEVERGSWQYLMYIVPISIGLILVLLYTAFNSLKDALLVMVNVIAAFMGGIWALRLTQTPFSISAATESASRRYSNLDIIAPRTMFIETSTIFILYRVKRRINMAAPSQL